MRGQWFGIGFGAWAAGLGVYTLALAVTVPATLADAVLQQVSHGRLRITEARGTLWSGAGQLEIRDARQRTSIAEQVSWRIRPLHLLRAQLVSEIHWGFSAMPFQVALSVSRIDIADADLDFPAAILAAVEPRLAPLGLTGDLRLQIARWSIDHRDLLGNATLHWRNAASIYAQVSPLGDYELRFTGEGAAVRATLLTLRGPLQLDGQGYWNYNGMQKFSASAFVPPQHRQQLAPLLQLITVERGEGIYDLQLK